MAPFDDFKPMGTHGEWHAPTSEVVYIDWVPRIRFPSYLHIIVWVRWTVAVERSIRYQRPQQLSSTYG